MSLPAEDMFAIQMLYARFYTSVDDGNIDALMDTFTKDAIYGRAKPEGEEYPERKDNVGHAEIEKFFRLRAEQYKGGARHNSSDIIIEGEGDRADCSVTVTIIDYRQGEPKIFTSARSQDVIVKETDGKWRFSRRMGRPDNQNVHPGLESVGA